MDQTSAGTGTKSLGVAMAGTSDGTRSGVAGTASGGGTSGTGSQIGAQTGASGTAAGASGNSTTPERCTQEGMMRCSMQGQGKRELCSAGVWASAPACAASETCTSQGGAPACAKIAELCKGSNGQAVCDAQGTLFLCNPDDTVSAQMLCKSARLCQDGIAARSCAQCVAKEEYQCTGAALEVCADDGKSFAKAMDCTSAALCNKNLGMCTSAVCMPETFSCKDNVLKKCKADSSAFDDATAMPCGMGTCDSKGGDCNVCEPGQKSCMGDSATMCDPTGQMLVPMPCGSGMKCTGAGQCVQCTDDSDCGELTKDCKVGACVQYKCVAKDAAASKACTASNGKPGKCMSGGSCECTPQCNKPCGDNGCGAQCPNTCGALMCVKDKCVECTGDGQCTGGTDCEAAVCGSDGRCTRSSAPREGVACRTGGVPGSCTAGKCVCKSDCGTQKCETDSCGKSCTKDYCGPVMECQSNTCRPKPTVPTTSAPSRCTPGVSGACAATDFCDSTLNYCTTYCDGNSALCPSRECLAQTACGLIPPCPAGMTVVNYSGVQACAFAHAP